MNTAAKRAAKKQQQERMNAIRAAVIDEQSRFNEAIYKGAVVMLNTATSGPLPVKYVDGDWMYHTGNGLNSMSWAGCNNGTWAELLAQAGVERHPMWAALVAPKVEEKSPCQSCGEPTTGFFCQECSDAVEKGGAQ